jgi:alpha-tubulin suppressor-like RCC1 family protein
MPANNQTTTNFRDSGNGDLGKNLVTKDYLISVYPELAESIGRSAQLWSWGSNLDGLIGTGGPQTSTPVPVLAGTNWKTLCTGSSPSNAAAIKTDGTLWIWGSNVNSSSTGTGDNTGVKFTPVTTFAGGTNWKQISFGSSHVATIKTDGTLWTWGYNFNGQIGNPNRTRLASSTTPLSTPTTTFSGGNTWKQVSCGNNHTAAIKTDGTLWIWGDNSNFQLGTGSQTILARSTPVTTFVGGTTWANTATGAPEEITIACAAYSTFAMKTDGTLWSWGADDEGLLGYSGNNVETQETPAPLSGINWKQISSYSSSIAAIKTDGTLWRWGRVYNFESAGGGGSGFGIAGAPIQYPSGVDWASIASGTSHYAAIKTNGTLWLWGANGIQQIGNNAADASSFVTTPVTTFAGGTNWKQVACGFQRTVAIKTDGTLWAWGNNGNGSLGTNDSQVKSTPVTTFVGGTNWKQVSLGAGFTAAIKTDGTLWTWGFANSGQLGHASLSDRSTPVTTFVGGTNWKQVHAMVGGATIAVKTDGTLWVWGGTSFGINSSLGTNDNANRSTPVTTFAGGTNWVQVSGGQSHFIALKSDGTVWTWGYNLYGQLGINFSYKFSITPITTFLGGNTWKQVSCGNNHTAAIKTDGTLWTWGQVTSGQLGNASVTSNTVFTPITTFAGGTNWKYVVASHFCTAAIKTNGTLWIWGNNFNSNLGINTNTSNISVPSNVFGYSNDWKTVSLSTSGNGVHVGAIKTDGTLWVWGGSSSGQLGINALGNKSTPVTTFLGGSNWKQVFSANRSMIAIQSGETI